MERRAEFVMLARQEGADVRELCRRFGVSPPTADRWRRRAAQGATAGLVDRSRRPHASPSRTEAALEAAVLRCCGAAVLRCCGAAVLRCCGRATRTPPGAGARSRGGCATGARRLRDRGAAAVPAPPTVTAILRRHGRLDDAAGAGHGALARFERSAPNELLRPMDVKGPFAHGAGRRHPLTGRDDHARSAICLAARADEQRGATVRGRPQAAFERDGLPDCMPADNGAPWGGGSATARDTPLVVRLLRLGGRMIPGRARHPQTQGEGERFHRTLAAAVIQGRRCRDLAGCERAFARRRDVYNLERPHQALDLAVPARRYRPSPRAFPLPGRACPGSPPRRTTRSVGSSTAAGSASTAARSGCPRRSAASRSASGRPTGTASGRLCSSASASRAVTCAPRREVQPATMSPV